jgi:hypothetical protein
MYRILKFYVIIFSILLLKMNSKMIKCGMVMLREKSDVVGADVG